MTAHSCKILTIAPYHILPVDSGGRAAIVTLHDAIGKICEDHIVSTTKNKDNTKYSFKLHKLFNDKPNRYIPYNGASTLLNFAKEHNITHIICEHPYMALTVDKLAKKLGIKWYLRSHNIESERFRTLGKKWWPILRKYEQYAMQKAAGVFFITPEDAQWAQQNFGLATAQCHTIPFGTVLNTAPEHHNEDKATLAKQLSIDGSVPWLYFLGALGYAPNYNAVDYILNEIAPRLSAKGQQYQILIAGQGLPQELQQQISATKEAHYLGYVDDLHQFINASDVMLNPVLTGGGIKTKAVEALGYNKTVVSSQSGAAGLITNVCGEKLLIAADYDWDSFAELTIKAIADNSNIPDAFYHTYNNDNIAKKVVDILLSE